MLKGLVSEYSSRITYLVCLRDLVLSSALYPLLHVKTIRGLAKSIAQYAYYKLGKYLMRKRNIQLCKDDVVYQLLAWNSIPGLPRLDAISDLYS